MKLRPAASRHPAGLRMVLAGVVLGALLMTGQAPALAAGPGPIAYVRPNDTTGDEIRLIQPDGTGDRLLWGTGRAGVPMVEDVAQLAWRPDAGELAFASRHEEQCSFFNADIYSIRPDGGDYRRVTGPPACGQGTGLPTGTVRVPVSNESGESGPFVVYFEGAPGPQMVSLPSGGDALVTFEDVADFGSNKTQWAVAVYGEQRYTNFNARVDVQPGATVDTGALVMAGPVNDWGWRWPTYRSDGSQIATVFGPGILYHVAAGNTTPGNVGSELLTIDSVDMPGGPKYLAWAPAPSRANELLYSAYVWGKGDTILRVGEGNSTAGEALVNVDGGVGAVTLGLAWLPDASGFLYSVTESFGDRSNIYVYTFAAGSSARLTDFASGYTRRISVAPDGQRIVFERQFQGSWTDTYAVTDLWVINRDGTGAAQLVQNAAAPAWSPAALPEYRYVYLPALLR